VKDPLANTDKAFLDRINNHPDINEGSQAFATRHYHKSEYLRTLKDIASIE